MAGAKCQCPLCAGPAPSTHTGRACAMHTAYPCVNKRDMMCVTLQERYTGLAQISNKDFGCPRVLRVELLVFADDDCMGLLWQSPVHSFSLLSRLPGLP